MPNLDPPAPAALLARLHFAARLFGGWLAFFAMMAAVSLALVPPSPERTIGLLEIDFVAAVTWTIMTLAIASYHRRLRAVTSKLLPFVIVHLIGLALAAMGDAIGTR